MSQEEKLINVIMKDGNRTVNWDFKESTTVLECLKRWNFEWEPNTVHVCGFLVFESQLDKPITDYMYAASKVYEYPKRVYIEMTQPVKKKEAVSDVG